VHADTLKERARLSALSDEDLVLKVQAGETLGFDILVDRYKVRLYNYLLRLLRNEDEAEEIAQETFVKAFIHADKYKTIASSPRGSIRSRRTSSATGFAPRSERPGSSRCEPRADGEEELPAVDLVDTARQPTFSSTTRSLRGSSTTRSRRYPRSTGRASC